MCQAYLPTIITKVYILHTHSSIPGQFQPQKPFRALYIANINTSHDCSYLRLTEFQVTAHPMLKFLLQVKEDIVVTHV